MFEGGTDLGAVGVFTGPDPVADKVIDSGDLMLESVIRFASPVALNDAGQIAVIYGLADGTQGIAIATPVLEPIAVSTLAIAAAALVRCRRSTNLRLSPGRGTAR